MTVLLLHLTAAEETVPVAAAADHTQVMLGLIALVSLCLTALVWVIKNGSRLKTIAEDAALAATQASAANKAVNNVGPDGHVLYDMVATIKADVAELKKDQARFDSHGWETLPPDLGTAVGLTTTIRDLQHDHKRGEEKLDTLIAELRSHVAWEEHEKYGKP